MENRILARPTVRKPRAWILLALPVAAALAIYLTFLGGKGDLDGHEALVGQTAREMVRSGDWVCPTFSGELRFQKPPLAYWLTGAVYLTTGVSNEVTARLPSAVIAALGVAFITWYAARRVNDSFGLLVGLMHATTFWTVTYARSALVDSTLAVLVASAILLASFDRLPRFTRWWLAVLGFWICCGLAVLAKGPVGLAVILPTVASYRLLRDRRPENRSLLLHPASALGIVVFLALSLGWPLAVWQYHPEAAALWMEQSVGRYMEHWRNDPPPWYYYLYYAPLLTLPWTPLWLWDTVRSMRKAVRRKLQSDDFRLLCWLWIVTAFVFFSLSAGKRSHYILPALTPFSFLAAFGFYRWMKFWKPLAIARRRQGIVAVVAVAVVAGAASLATLEGAEKGAAFAFTCAVALAAIAAIDWTAFPLATASSVRFWGAVVCAFIILESAVVPAFEDYPGRRAMLRRNQRLFEQTDLVVQYGSNDHSTAFHVDRPMRWVRTPAELQAAFEENDAVIVLAPAAKWEELSQSWEMTIFDRSGPRLSVAEERKSRQFGLAVRKETVTSARRRNSRL